MATQKKSKSRVSKKVTAKRSGPPNQHKTKYVDMTLQDKGTGTVISRGGLRKGRGTPEYKPRSAKGLDETEDYGRAIRYTKFGERNTTVTKRGTYQTVTNKKTGVSSTRKISNRNVKQVRGSESPKKSMPRTKKSSVRSVSTKYRGRR